MIIVQRQVRGKKTKAAQCTAAGCNHSARFDAIFLGTEHVLLCTKCAREWGEAYDNALRGWPDEPAHQIAEDYRAQVAAC